METPKIDENQRHPKGLPGLAKSDLLHHVDAISLALKNWNDTQALKLLRLHWPEIRSALCKLDFGRGNLGSRSARRCHGERGQGPAQLDDDVINRGDVINRSVNDEVLLPTSPLPTAP